jgi:transposase InsO family protein
VIDTLSRERLSLHVDGSLPLKTVTAEIDHLIAKHGKPLMVTRDSDTVGPS